MSQEPSWRDARDQPVAVPAVPAPGAPAFYAAIGDFQGEHYRRNAFTAGTAEELTALRAAVTAARGAALTATDRVLDVGCGDGRHLRALARAVRGVGAVGVDVSAGLVAAGRAAARAAGVGVDLRVGDARELTTLVADVAPVDVAWSLCQGALGTSPQLDPRLVAQVASVVRPGGIVIVTLFHALFAVRHLVPGDAFDPVHLVHHQVSEVRGPDDSRRSFDLWTASYTVREALHLLSAAGLEPVSIRGCEPGAFSRRADGEVGLDDPELFLVARRPNSPAGRRPSGQRA